MRIFTHSSRARNTATLGLNGARHGIPAHRLSKSTIRTGACSRRRQLPSARDPPPYLGAGRAVFVCSQREGSEPEIEPRSPNRDLAARFGASSVLLIVASFVVWGNTPKGDASAEKVFAHYADNRTEGVIAAGQLAVSTISLWHLPPCCVSAQGR